jgi:hypothetical protein
MLGDTHMRADERVSALGQASGSAEVAAQALSAVKRALDGKELKPEQKEALTHQAELVKLLVTAPVRARNASSLAAMLSQEGPWTLRLHERLGTEADEAALRDAGDFLTWLASAPYPVEIDRTRADRVLVLCKQWLSAALDLLGSATRESAVQSPESPKRQ